MNEFDWIKRYGHRNKIKDMIGNVATIGFIILGFAGWFTSFSFGIKLAWFGVWLIVACICMMYALDKMIGGDDG